MKTQEFKAVVKRAATLDAATVNQVADSAWVTFLGIAYERGRRIATFDQAAYFVRYQSLCFDGSWDMQELANCRACLRKVDIVEGCQS